MITEVEIINQEVIKEICSQGCGAADVMATEADTCRKCVVPKGWNKRGRE
jgi:ribosomal protein L40E